MEATKDFVRNADRLAGATAIILIAFGLIQIVLGEIFSKSVALTANGFDCIGDGFVSAIVGIGLKISRKPADDKFHYGYYKMENLASIAAAVVMMLLAAYIVFRSYNQLIDPQEIQFPFVGAIIAAISAIVALALGFYKYLKGKQSKMSSVKLDAFNTVKDGTTSGLTVLALLLSFVGISIADAVVGFIIAGIIVSIGFAAIKESSYTLVDACDGYCLIQGSEIKKIVESVKGVKSATVVRMRRSGPIFQGEVEIKVPAEMSVKELDKIQKRIMQLAKEKYPDIERLTITVVTD
jgi:cation diffusion facilitator family transporter